MRWKIFIPLALALTIISLAGNHFWANYTDRAHATSLTSDAIYHAEIVSGTLSITVADGHRIADVISVLETNDDNSVWSRVRDFKLVPQNKEAMPGEIVQQVNLISAQAQATKEYYNASLLLRDIAAQNGLQADTYLWSGWLLMEIRDDSGAYYSQIKLDQGVAE